jgi:hypothetical protein
VLDFSPEVFMPRPVRCFCLVAALLAAADPAFALEPLDGWGNYKFGIRPDQVRAVPGQSFGRYSVTNIDGENIGAMAGQKTAIVNGIAYTLDVYFDPPLRLSRISLENETTMSRPDCEKRFLTLLSQFEKNYGGFSPVNPQHPQNAQDQLPSSLVWKSQAASRYQLSTVPIGDETAYVWEARKSDGPRYVDIVATWSARDGDTAIACLMDIYYNGK